MFFFDRVCYSKKKATFNLMKQNLIHTILAALFLLCALIFALMSNGDYVDYKKLMLAGFTGVFGIAELTLIYSKHKLGTLMLFFNLVAAIICFLQLSNNTYTDMLLALPITSLFLSLSALLMNDFSKKLNKISVILLFASLLLTINLFMNSLVSTTIFNTTIAFVALSFVTSSVSIIKTKQA